MKGYCSQDVGLSMGDYEIDLADTQRILFDRKVSQRDSQIPDDLQRRCLFLYTHDYRKQAVEQNHTYYKSDLRFRENSLLLQIYQDETFLQAQVVKEL